jgi:ABC-type sulfate transport system permease subunit
MSTRRPLTPDTLDDRPIPVQAKLAAAWTSFMFLYAYVDILGFYTPGAVKDILDGKVYEFDLSQTFSTTVLAVLAVPIFMVVLSMTLPARLNRTTNLVVAALLVPFTVFNVAGGVYVLFYGLGVALELVLLALIVRYAWTWPHSEPSATTATGSARAAVRARPHA